MFAFVIGGLYAAARLPPDKSRAVIEEFIYSTLVAAFIHTYPGV